MASMEGVKAVAAVNGLFLLLACLSLAHRVVAVDDGAAAAAPRTSSPTSVVSVRSCQDANCSVGCTTSSFPLDQCFGGVQYACQPSLLQCMDVVNYNNSAQNDDARRASMEGAATCTAAEMNGPSSMVCDYCTSYVNRYQNGSVYGVFRDCADNASRAFHYNCNVDCTECVNAVPVHLGACTVNPIDGVYAIVPLRVRSCNQLLTMSYWVEGNCSGPAAQEGAVPTNTCLYEGDDTSSSYTCTSG